jgi:hypothetical protein
MKQRIYFILFTFLSLLLNVTYSQSQWQLTGNSGTSITSNFVGTTDAKDLVFQTNSVGGTSQSFWWKTNGGALQMSLDALGNLDINNCTCYYAINGSPVLWHNGNTSCVYVGVSAGGTGSTGNNNSFIGAIAGTSNSTGELNTFTGAWSGYSNVDGNQNTFTGAYSETIV